jgi:hypothetical protein
MPVGVIVTVGGPAGAGGGEGGGEGVLTGGVGAVGVVIDAPLEHAATAINDRTMKADLNTASPSMPEGAPGLE